jgi:Zn-dependent protease
MSDATQSQPTGRSGATPVPHGPSPIFLGLLALTAGSAWALWAGVGSPGVFALLTVVGGGVVYLCLHEFAHAAVAYRFGDHSVVHRGYLTLNPLRYTHVMYSLVLPVLFVLLGGIGLPGGAVFIDRRALRTRFASSAVSAAGPLTNIAIAILLALALTLRDDHIAFWSAIAFLLFLQVTAAVLNVIPVPGLDGFGVLEPYLPRSLVNRAARFAPFAIIALFGLLWIPAVNRVFFTVVLGIVSLLGVDPALVGAGYQLFRFWLQ